MAGPTDNSGWLADPTGRHELRFHDGAAFTSYVSDQGVVTSDGPAPPPTVVDMPMIAPLVVPGAAPSVGPPPPTPGYQAAPSMTSGPYASAHPWPSGGGSPDVPRPPDRRTAMWIAVGVGAVEALVIVVLAVALAARSEPSTASVGLSTAAIGTRVAPTGAFGPDDGHTVYSSTFGPNDGWYTGSINSNTAAAVHNGRYVVRAWTSVHHLLLTPYGKPLQTMSVEASATGYPSGNITIGDGCQSTSGISRPVVFQVVVYPDGAWYLEEGRVSGSVKILASGSTAGLGSSGSVQLTCATTYPDATTTMVQVVGFVDGVRIGAAGERIDHVRLGGFEPVLVVGTYGETVSTSFTQVTVRSLDPSS